jgi:hypothetical protein
MQIEDVKLTARSNPSQRIIAAGDRVRIFILCLGSRNHPAAGRPDGLFSRSGRRGLGADPYSARAGRAGGDACGHGDVCGVGYLVAVRADQFVADWPRYSGVLRHVTTAFDRQLSTVEKGVEAIAPAPEKGRTPPRSVEPPPVRDWLLRGVGSLYSFLLVATFVPFLVFFMLAAKPRIWKATMELFPGRASGACPARSIKSAMLRSFMAGNALVAMILMLLSWAFFMWIHLDYPFLLGCVSGAAESGAVPRRGTGVDSAILDRHGAVEHGRSLHRGVAAALTFLHIIGLNVLMPAIVGRRVHLNAPCGHRFVAVLGMAVGRDWTAPGDSHHGDGQGDLRSCRGMGAGGPLARRDSPRHERG